MNFLFLMKCDVCKYFLLDSTATFLTTFCSHRWPPWISWLSQPSWAPSPRNKRPFTRVRLLIRPPEEEMVRFILVVWLCCLVCDLLLSFSYCFGISCLHFYIYRWKESARSQCPQYRDCPEQQTALLSLVHDLLLILLVTDQIAEEHRCRI